MEHEVIAVAAAAASGKDKILRHSPGQYLVLSMLAGAYVGLGIILIFAVGAPLNAAGSAATKAVMAVFFGVALTLVIFAGSELFTGNNLIMAIGRLSGSVTSGAVARIWTVSFIGNLIGSGLLALVVLASGVLANAPTQKFVLAVAAAKMGASGLQLFCRGVLCNVLVCLAVWMGMKTKDDVARLVLIFWCLLAFIGAGFEHSVANMTLLSVSLLLPHDPSLISWLGFARNLGWVTFGNVVGGALLVGLPYWYIATGQRRALGLRIIHEEPSPPTSAPGLASTQSLS